MGSKESIASYMNWNVELRFFYIFFTACLLTLYILQILQLKITSIVLLL